MSKYLLTYLGFGGVALLLGFGPIPAKIKTAWFHAGGFYFILVAVLLWLHALLAGRRPQNIWSQFKPHVPALILSDTLIAGMLLISPPRLRILYDETNLLGVSQAMFEYGAFYIPTQALFQSDQIHLIDHEWGIRPLLFPFFLYTIHLLKGYAAANVFWLNAIAGATTLFFFYLLLQRLFSKPMGLIGMGLLTAYPLFVLWTTSGGFEILNLWLAVLAFYLL